MPNVCVPGCPRSGCLLVFGPFVIQSEHAPDSLNGLRQCTGFNIVAGGSDVCVCVFSVVLVWLADGESVTCLVLTDGLFV